MTKKALDTKYSYQIDEYNRVHLFRGEDDCQQYLTNPLLGAIFKIETLEKENAELKEKLKPENCLKSLAKSGLVKFTYENGNEHDQLIKARELILKLYNVGRDVLMCRTKEKAYDNLSEAINDKSIEQFLKETEKMKHTSEEIKYRLSDLGVQIGNIAIEYITELEKERDKYKARCEHYERCIMQMREENENSNR